MDSNLQISQNKESLSYLFVVHDLFKQSIITVQKDNCELNRLNSIIWLMTYFEVINDIQTIFPKLISKSSIKGDTFSEKDLSFSLVGSKIKIVRSTEFKLIRDKYIHGKQDNFKQNKEYNDKSWYLFGLCYDGEPYFIKKIAEQSTEMLVFLKAVESEINQNLGYDLREKLKRNKT